MASASIVGADILRFRRRLVNRIKRSDPHGVAGGSEGRGWRGLLLRDLADELGPPLAHEACLDEHRERCDADPPEDGRHLNERVDECCEDHESDSWNEDDEDYGRDEKNLPDPFGEVYAIPSQASSKGRDNLPQKCLFVNGKSCNCAKIGRYGVYR